MWPLEKLQLLLLLCWLDYPTPFCVSTTSLFRDSSVVTKVISYLSRSRKVQGFSCTLTNQVWPRTKWNSPGLWFKKNCLASSYFLKSGFKLLSLKYFFIKWPKITEQRTDFCQITDFYTSSLCWSVLTYCRENPRIRSWYFISEPFPAHTGMITLCALKALPLYLTEICAFTYVQQILPNKTG